MCPTNLGAKVHKISDICKRESDFSRKKARGSNRESWTGGGKQPQHKQRQTTTNKKKIPFLLAYVKKKQYLCSRKGF